MSPGPIELMDLITESLVPFLAILNPFALCLYLADVMEELSRKEFARVLLGASLISLPVFWLFAVAGEPLLVRVLGVRPAALRAFGGVIFLVVGYNYVVKGYQAAIVLRGSLDNLPSVIALPFMIGAGTITQAILIGKSLPTLWAMLTLLLGVAGSFVVVVAFKLIRDHMKDTRERLFDRYVNILARINGLLIGALSTQMIVSGLRQLWLGPSPGPS